MSFRRFATGAALAIAGLAAAVGIGLLANSISGDSVGLGAEPLSAGETLAPASAREDDGAGSASAATETATATAAATTPPRRPPTPPPP